ncbi:MAG: hypothetical protein LBB81_09400 [Treponema sp.]|nr:hypothetical protein [Treponema sp.]
MNSLKIVIEIEGVILPEKITLTFGDGESADTGLSNFGNNWKTCPWDILPDNGKDLNDKNYFLNKINKHEDLTIKYNVFLKQGSKFEKEWFSAQQQVKAEMAVLLPLNFGVDPDAGEANLIFPNLFSSGDLFGRSKDGNSTVNIIQYLELGIELDTNPFQDAELFIRSDKGKFELKNENKTSVISIVFNEDTMKKINDPAYIPFIPEISYHFDRGDTLLIPRALKAKNLKFKAKIFYNYDLGGNG